MAGLVVWRELGVCGVVESKYWPVTSHNVGAGLTGLTGRRGRTDGDTMTVLATLLLPLVAAQPRIINFSGTSEFKRVSLNWAVDNDGQEPTGLFRLKFCENQIWGEHYCQERLLEDNPDRPEFSTDIYGRT